MTAQYLIIYILSMKDENYDMSNTYQRYCL